MTNTRAVWQRQRCPLSVCESQRFSDIKAEERARTTTGYGLEWQREIWVCVFMWDVSNMEGISIEKTKNLILILDIFQILKKTYMNACIFFITMHSLYLLSSLRYNQLHFKHLSFLPFSFSFSLYVRSAFSSCLLIFHVGPPIPAYQYPRHDTPQVQSIILITDQAAELCLCVCMCLCVLMDHFFLLTKP